MIDSYLRCFMFVTLVALTSGCSRVSKWEEEVLLHNGSIVIVERSVEWAMGSQFQSYPSKYSLTAVNPNTARKITWSGERNINPVMLDFSDDSAYLLLMGDGGSMYRSEKYGCPTIPYALLVKQGSRDWKLVSLKSAPKVFMKANLDAWYDGASIYSVADVSRANQAHAFASSDFFTADFPRDYDSWKYKNKERYVVNRYDDDCRPRLPQPVDALNPSSPRPSSVPVDIELLTQQDFKPAWVVEGSGTGESRWSEITISEESTRNCKELLLAANPDDPRLDSWRRFRDDPTSTRVTPAYSDLICGADAVWVVDYVAEPARVVVVKGDSAGRVLYRASFPRPEAADGRDGAIIRSTFALNDGYIYLEYWNVNQSGADMYVWRTRGYRFREPTY